MCIRDRYDTIVLDNSFVEAFHSFRVPCRFCRHLCSTLCICLLAVTKFFHMTLLTRKQKKEKKSKSRRRRRRRKKYGLISTIHVIVDVEREQRDFESVMLSLSLYVRAVVCINLLLLLSKKFTDRIRTFERGRRSVYTLRTRAIINE